MDRGVPLYEALGMAGEVVGVGPAARIALGELRGMFDRLRRKVETTPVNVLLDEVLDGSGYVAWLDGRRTEDTAQRLPEGEGHVSAAREFVASIRPHGGTNIHHDYVYTDWAQVPNFVDQISSMLALSRTVNNDP